MIRVAQVTDTHLLADPEARLRGVVTQSTLRTVLAEVARERPDLILLTGDLADLGEPEAYRHLVELINPLQIPAYWLPGNHDDPTIMPDLFAGSWIRTASSFQVGNWRVILLNSVVPGASHGLLSPEALEDLNRALAEEPECPTLVALHHNPVPIGSPMMDSMGLKSPEEFFKQIDSAPQVRVILFGHIHWAFHTRRGTVDIYGTPSSCKQLPPNGEFTDPEEALPGFRLLELYPEGFHRTQIGRALDLPKPEPIPT